MKKLKINRRRFILAGLVLAPAAALADARWVEPHWLKLKKLRLTKALPAFRFVHFTDLHHKGDRSYGESMVKLINAQSPDFVCFTGDLIEEPEHLAEALEIIAQIKAPVFGVPGNHDYWAKVPFDKITEGFAATGGGWLLDQNVIIQNGTINLIGITCKSATQPAVPIQAGLKNILLMHYPAWVKKLGSQQFDVILAGHSHGGQVRLPFYGPIAIPFGVDEFDLGLFTTQNGPLYVNPGIGWFLSPLRFRCRPEITVIEI
ncbi:MAG: metallophosphoesterase [Verrucomicrobiae bacterium]|nr:metallophosphoesterase [Verrucomicrobiae bacterium]